ncbi:hypothetical protein AAVH_17084 [Aphelenchoides avenae]|nr:hypothetical protein AAVH_17084 [Aphelenchus avenae]
MVRYVQVFLLTLIFVSLATSAVLRGKRWAVRRTTWGGGGAYPGYGPYPSYGPGYSRTVVRGFGPAGFSRTVVRGFG